MTDQPTPETPAPFIPPAARNLPLAALDSATSGADMLDAHATTPTGRNFLAHALVQLARDGWLRTEPGAGFEPVDDDLATATPPQDVPQPPDAGAETPDGAGGRQTDADGRGALREQYAAALGTLTVLGGAPPARLVPVIDWGAGKTTHIADWQPLDTLLDALLAVRDAELEKLRQRLELADADLADYAAAESADAAAGSYALRAETAEQHRDQLAATLAEVLDAFDAYWARASYCGPGETAIQPEHLQAWRAVLNGKEQP